MNVAAARQPAGTADPSPQGGDSRLEILLHFEEAARDAENAQALAFLAVNEIRRLVPARQAFWLVPRGLLGKLGALRITHASAVSEVDHNAPLVRTLEAAAAATITETGGPVPLDLGAINLDGSRYAFRHALIVPLTAHGRPPAAWLLLAAEQPWQQGDIVVATRIGGTLGHALTLFRRVARSRTVRRLNRFTLILATALVAELAVFVPVPLTVLAPVEVAGRDAFAVTAPLDGVVRRIVVEPNAPVEAGELLAEMVDTGLRGDFDIAERAADIAEARLRRARQGAFQSAEMRHELAIAVAEYEAQTARRDLAAARLERTRILAPASGLAIFNRKEDWTGRPVSTGEWIMQIADPARVELHIDLALGDTAALAGDGELRVFLDDAPLDPLDARITASGYLVEQTAAQGLAYPVRAELSANTDGDPPRIGTRGTAQIFGPRVSLGYFLFRRPLAIIRQKLGL